LPEKISQGIIQSMASIADHWWNEDRRDLFRSVECIASETPDLDRVSLCLDTILNDLELYDDPHQGVGAWLYEDEIQTAERLGEKLSAATDGMDPVDAGPPAVASITWAEARTMASQLLQLMKSNGDFAC
jgi:hypothetical protein